MDDSPRIIRVLEEDEIAAIRKAGWTINWYRNDDSGPYFYITSTIVLGTGFLKYASRPEIGWYSNYEDAIAEIVTMKMKGNNDGE